jgi:glycosyltransferase involved in cell wall biosynthesis
MNERKNILVLAYAISPFRGSEYSVSWNYIIHMSTKHNLYIFYGMSGDHMGDTLELETYLINNPLPNTTFIPVKPNSFVKFLNFFNTKGVFVYTFYFAYQLWHKQVFYYVKNLLKNTNIDLIHYLGPIGYREPGYLWKFNLPYIWGPISGAKNINFLFFRIFSINGVFKYFTRYILNNLQLFCNPRLKKALIKTNLLLTATTYDNYIFNKVYNIKSIIIPENGIIKFQREFPISYDSTKTLQLVWIGTIDDRKALVLLLDALLKLNSNKVVLNIIGDGVLKSNLQNYLSKHIYNFKVNWHGHIKRENVFEILSDVHLHILTSSLESYPTVLWETMSFAIPTISLNHCGMSDIINDNTGVKIQILSICQIVDDLCSAINSFLSNPDKIKFLSSNIITDSANYGWQSRITKFEKYYDVAINNYNEKSC